MKTLKARKNRKLTEPIKIIPLAQMQVVLYVCIPHETVNTEDGLMESAELRKNAEIADPSHEVAAHVGAVDIKHHQIGGVPDQVWFWRDKFWLKGRDSSNVEYYLRKKYLLYPVEIDNPDIIEELRSIYN